MRIQLIAVIASILVAHPASGQRTPALQERGVYLTVFRSPATGVELRQGHAAAHVGFYPTILSRNGSSASVNFIRVGGSYYLRPSGSTPYISPSLLFSLDRAWKHGGLTEIGFRGTLYRSLHGRVGAAVLATIAGEVRVNPTIGMDVRLGGAR